jgi:hypothetical protein
MARMCFAANFHIYIRVPFRAKTINGHSIKKCVGNVRLSGVYLVPILHEVHDTLLRLQAVYFPIS